MGVRILGYKRKGQAHYSAVGSGKTLNLFWKVAHTIALAWLISSLCKATLEEIGGMI